MNPIVIAILKSASELAVPRVKEILENKLGDKGVLVGQVVEKIAQKAGVVPDELPKLGTDALQRAIIDTEPETPELLAQLNAGQSIMVESIALDYQKEQWWAWGWRPAWMWLLGFLWTYQLLLQPIVKAAFLPDLPQLASSDLLAVSGIYMTLYLGGHTAKKVLAPGR